MENSLVVGILGILALSTLSMMAYYWYFNRQLKQIGQLGQGFENSSEGAWNSLHNAMKKSEAIVSQAELEGVKVVAQSKLHSDLFEQRAVSEIDMTSKAIQKELLAESTRATEEYKKYLKTLEDDSGRASSEMKQLTEQKIEKMIDLLGTDLSEKLAQVESKSIVAAEAEVAAMKKAVEEYRKKRLAAIDEDSVAIFNRAISLVLRDVPINTHIDIIKKSIDQAKAEHFIT